MSVEELKTAIEAATSLSRGALHIYAAVLVQIGVALLLRRSLANPLPWLCALLVTVADEWLEQAPGGLELPDAATAMIIPTVLLLATRFAPSILQPRPRRGRKKG